MPRGLAAVLVVPRHPVRGRHNDFIHCNHPRIDSDCEMRRGRAASALRLTGTPTVGPLPLHPSYLFRTCVHTHSNTHTHLRTLQSCCSSSSSSSGGAGSVTALIDVALSTLNLSRSKGGEEPHHCVCSIYYWLKSVCVCMCVCVWQIDGLKEAIRWRFNSREKRGRRVVEGEAVQKRWTLESERIVRQ